MYFTKLTIFIIIFAMVMNITKKMPTPIQNPMHIPTKPQKSAGIILTAFTNIIRAIGTTNTIGKK